MTLAAGRLLACRASRGASTSGAEPCLEGKAVRRDGLGSGGLGARLTDLGIGTDDTSGRATCLFALLVAALGVLEPLVLLVKSSSLYLLPDTKELVTIITS